MNPTYRELMGQYYALLECAEHLDQDWTEDSNERKGGKVVAAWLRERAATVFSRAQRRRKWDGFIQERGD